MLANVKVKVESMSKIKDIKFYLISLAERLF